MAYVTATGDRTVTIKGARIAKSGRSYFVTIPVSLIRSRLLSQQNAYNVTLEVEARK